MVVTNTLQKTAALVSRNFDLSDVSPSLPTCDDLALQQLQGLVASEIDRLLAFDFERLMQIFYRIDVEEEKVRQILFSHQQVNVSMELARLVIERQLQKVKNWEKYSQYQ